MQITDNFEVEKTFVERAPFPSGGEESGTDGGDINSSSEKYGGAASTAAARIKNPYLHGEPSAATIPIVGKTRLGSGLVKDVIGRGGMASVYLVWNERLEIYRAVKMLSLDALYDRFETEIKISAKLRHPNIVEIYGVGEWNGLSYMEMEYIDGENMQQILSARGRFPETVCCAAAICVADALSYAHSLNFTIGDNSYNGIIHRDLKPANIMFSKNGNVKLTDFGIARPAQAGLHTTEGNIVGTLHYLSPEQMEGKSVDHRSDIYSLGTLIYEMATGTKTFPQETITELMRQRASNNFKKTSEYDFQINPALSKIINKCLEANPKNRYQNTETLLDDLRKAHAALTELPPEKVLSIYYPAEDGGAALTRSIEKTTISQAPTKKERSATAITITTKHLFIAAPLAILILALTAILSVMIASGQKNGGADTTGIVMDKSIQDISSDNTAAANDNNGDAAIIEAEPERASAPAPTQTYIQKSSQITAQTAQSPKPAQSQRLPAVNASVEPKQSEDDLIRAATAAISGRDFAGAIRILERGDDFNDKKGWRDILLLDAYVETKRLDRAQTLLDAVAPTDDALYFLSAGRYWYYRGNHARALEMLESSLTRSSALRNRSVIFGDAIYYIAMVRNERLKSAPSDANRAAALDGWRRVESTYSSKPDNPRLDRARREIAALN